MFKWNARIEGMIGTSWEGISEYTFTATILNMELPCSYKLFIS